MRILVYGLNFAPELTGIGKYTGEMCEWLAKHGHDMRVVTAPPYYPAWQIAAGYQGIGFRQETWQGIPIVRCPLWVPHRPNGWKRILHLTSFAVSSLAVVIGQAWRWRPDLIWVVAPAFFCLPGACLAGSLTKTKTWAHFQDLEMDAAARLGIAGTQVFAPWERWLLRQFDRVSTISPAMAERLRAKGVEADRLVDFPNWIDVEQIFPMDNDDGLREELGIPTSSRVILYSGNMGKKQGLETVIEAAYILKRQENLLFLLCGDGPTRPELERKGHDLGLTHVRFIPLQPPTRLNALLNLATLHLLPQRADMSEIVLPSKLAGMLACGGAVIATAEPQTALGKMVVAAGGSLTPPGDSQALADQILFLLEHPQHRQTMQQKAREYALAHLAQEAILQGFERQISDWLTPQPKDPHVL
ncbi:MAG: WcaI family glycosyltransferase [Cyanobacteriota bacterium]|nr:WcaI family glycosyltransferase [Cyanobacteriota bacterium]